MGRRHPSATGSTAIRPSLALILVLLSGATLLSGTALLNGAALHAQEITTKDLRIRKLPEMPAGSTHGYHEVIFEITNSSPTRSHDVRLQIPADSNLAYGSHQLHEISSSVVAGPSSTVRLTLLQPALPLAGRNDAKAFVDDREVLQQRISLEGNHPNDTLMITKPSGSGTATEPLQRVLVSQRVRIDALPQDPDPQRYLRANLPLSGWSDNWLAYSSYDGIVLTADDLLGNVSPRSVSPRSVPPRSGVRTALERYAETGGSLLVVDSPTPAPAGLKRLSGTPTVSEDGLDVFYVGLGEVLSSPLPLENLNVEQLERAVASWARTREPWNIVRNPSGAHRLFSVTSNIRVPVRGIFLVMIGFTLLIGPINLWLLSRLKRRIWMLWTVPVAALLTSLVVFLYAIFSEGLLRMERGAALTVLDERSHSAATFAWLGYYSTLTPGQGLRFSRQSEVSPIVEWSFRASGGANRGLRWRQDQHLPYGWINARLPSYFVVRKAELRRERLAVPNAASEAPMVTNGLGAAIQTLYLARSDGRIFTASNSLEAGASASLRSTSELAEGRPSALRTLYQAEFPRELDKIVGKPSAYLLPGTYLAVLAENPFLESAIEDVRESRWQALVYGILMDGEQ